MGIRVVRGLEAGKKELANRGIQNLTRDSEEVRARNKKLFGEALSAEGVVRRILDDVRSKGDAAVKEYAHILDGNGSDALEVDRQEIAGASNHVDEDLFKALKFSAQRIEDYHQSTLPNSWMDREKGLGESIIPMERVGVYAPGGTASYPSTVLMTAIPARVAGVSEVILCTPSTSPAVMAAAEIAGVDRVFRIGGVQAIGAMAYGTESVPRVDMVCGPGNVYVTLAKKEVFGLVAVDGLYGPTETVLIADATADNEHCAADLLAQAEHDPLASPILVTDSPSLVEGIEVELDRQIAQLERRDIAEAALAQGGCIVLVDNLDEALELANFVAPEHMCLLVEDPWLWVDKVRNAGGLFLGTFSPEVVGDYIAGPSHVMPTGGTARFSSALGVHQFLKTMPVIALKAAGFEEMAQAVSVIARAEGLTAHARAVEIRMEARKGGHGL
jgi:histidinol dehydrogenase